LLALLLALVLFALIDPALKARQGLSYGLRPLNQYACAGALIAGCIPASGYFQVPTRSMEPTLHPGEVFLADPTYYRHHAPSRGEVIIYFNPKNPTVHNIKRIVPCYVYVLGDNRANSTDSRDRTQHGAVPLGNLVARATDIVFSPEVSRMAGWIGTPAK
jgi:hypothetical protein